MFDHALFKGSIVLLVAALLCGCSHSQEVDAFSPTGPWGSDMKELIEASKDRPSASFVQQVLRDSQISDQEVQESALKHVQCMIDLGYPNFHADPIRNRHELGSDVPLSDKDLDKAVNDEKTCNQQSSYLNLSSLYSVMKKNPEKQDEMDVTAACLVKLNVVDPAYTGTEYRNDLEKYLREHADANNHVYSDPALGIPFIVSQEEGLEAAYVCRSDPQSVLKDTK